VSARFGFSGSLFIEVAQFGKIRMTEESVIVEQHLSIQRDESFVFRDHKRIDLSQGRIRFEIGMP
jgi:hypothetical protein